MRTLRKIDIEMMERELQVLESNEQSSIIGGVFTTSCTPQQLSAQKDCSMHAFAYVTGFSVAQVKEDFKNMYANEYFDTYYNTSQEKPWDYYYQQADNQMKAGGTGVSGAWIEKMFNECVESGYETKNANNHFDLSVESGIKSALSSDDNNGIYASLKITDIKNEDGTTTALSGSQNHAVVIKDYDSANGTFTYYDPQNQCSGTFNWAELTSVIMK